MNRVELIMRRKNVREFIKADPLEVILIRPGEPVKTPAGGRVAGSRSTLPRQRVRIVLNKRRFNNGIVDTEAGSIPHTDYLLIGQHTLNIKVNDEFQWHDQWYRVTGIYDNRTESFLCSIDKLGKQNQSA